MFFSLNQIDSSIQQLSSVHPFFGITFLTCKQYNLPIGKTINFSMDANTNIFLETFHRPDRQSRYFFQTYPVNKTKRWVKYDYASSGLQAINTQTFSEAFQHISGTKEWGWSDDYVNVLERKLKHDTKIPAFHMAVWLYQTRDWGANINLMDVVQTFIDEFNLTRQERSRLFDTQIPSDLLVDKCFNETPVLWKELRQILPLAPDAQPDEGGTLSLLGLKNVGPVKKATLQPTKRLTLITGDNGLGKTFLLECAWWALTGNWAGTPAYPRDDIEKEDAAISFLIETDTHKSDEVSIKFDWKALSWPEPNSRPTIPGLLVYARVDGSFAVWDPARIQSKYRWRIDGARSVFSSVEVWDGLVGSIEGLVRDWIRWQNGPDPEPFKIFTQVLKKLSPPDLGVLQPGKPTRIPDDPRDIPTLVHPYGTTPIVFASAGVRRIITLAYLIVWTWVEHLVSASHSKIQAQKRMVILVDEMEAHLHPHWQREVLPAVMSVGEILSPKLEVQFLIATHSPLVMASVESIFDLDLDSLVHFGLNIDRDVVIENLDFIRFGDISSWLTSPVFELQHARARSAEVAIEAAKELQLKSMDEITPEEVKSVSADLVKNLGPDDKFWPRWVAYAEKFGVEL